MQKKKKKNVKTKAFEKAKKKERKVRKKKYLGESKSLQYFGNLFVLFFKLQ